MALQLIATALMGLLLLVVVLFIARGIDWRSDNVITDHEEGELLSALAGNPVVWVVVFLALALGLPAVALLAVGDFGLPVPGAATAAMAAFGALVLAYLVGGTYTAARARNVSSAGATLVAALLLGGLLLVAVSGKLLMG